MFNLPYDNTGVTLELGELIASGCDIWAFDYPVPRSTIEYNGKTCKVDFDKDAFQKKITDHYRFRQIGQETPGRWLHYFRTRMREIMPYYVQLYEFDAKFRNIDDPLESYNLREEFERDRTNTGESSGTSSQDVSREGTGTNEKTGTQDNTRKFSNTPQGEISNLDSYLTEATVEDGDTTENATITEEASESTTSESSGTSTDTEAESYTLTRRGNIGVQPLGGEVRDIRNAFINIDQMVIDELNDLFLMVY